MKLLLTLLLLPACSSAVDLYSAFPDVIRPNERYVIYSHGLIVEGTDPQPVHPEFGVYDFPAIQSALFKGGGFNLIAEQRPQNTDIASYTTRLEGWVRKLLDAGVPARRITLVGFSRGSHLTAYVSARLRTTGIHTALLGACVEGDIPNNGVPLQLGGNLLSVFETTDTVLTCTQLAAHSRLTSFKEVSITTGKKHGAFFQPRVEWLEPLKAWIRETNR
jgi:hypothetical protein